LDIKVNRKKGENMKRLRDVIIVSCAVVGMHSILVQNATAQKPCGPRAISEEDAKLQKDSLPINKFEKKALTVLNDIYKNQRYRNVPTEDGRLLRVMAESMNAKHVVEIGTSTGYSTIWMGMALKRTGGKCTTYEIDAKRAETARANFKRADMADIITLVEGDAHAKVAEQTGTIDILFLDADKAGYVDYLKKLMPKVRKGGLIIAHNINLRMADPKYMEAITTNPKLETIVRGGVAITLKKE
jgi:caffeoyl-CoA O-methyltransferase